MATKKTGLYVKNTTLETLYIPGFAAFAPGEVRLVSKQDHSTLLSNPFLVDDAGHSDEPAPKVEEGGK